MRKCCGYWALCTMQLKNGGIGSLEVSRVRRSGRYDRNRDIWQRGSLKIDFNQPERIHFGCVQNQWIVCGTLPDGINRFFTIHHLPAANDHGSIQDAHSATILSFLNCRRTILFDSRLETAFRSQQCSIRYRSAARGEEKSYFRNDAFYN